MQDSLPCPLRKKNHISTTMIESRRGMLLMGACDQTQFGAHSLWVGTLFLTNKKPCKRGLKSWVII